ncbi:MAG: class I tRNA ligase family protein [Candidatus Levybacteria bacterium]|nr:class I tRNA ligase family protein [Candidatus Levybacteria bacterium]
MDKIYNHKTTEEKIYSLWEEKGFFKPEVNPKGKPYSIILPPPNANAPLHFGHAMYVVEDILIRFHRMLGDKALWLPGADHAGFETQFVFEKKLQIEGKSRFDFEREALFGLIWDFVQGNRPVMEGQLKRLGFSLDWTRKKFTMDQDIVKIVHETFKNLFDDGLVYRAERLVNYCTYDGTSFSDLEVVYEERKNPLYYIKYGPLVLATTRPETKFGDTAVAVHPDDSRYQKYIGKEIEIETVLGKARIKVIADKFVDREFGTGVVKITPSHDFDDFEVAQRHKLPLVRVINFDGTMNEKAGKFKGLYVKQARKQVVEEMQAKGLIDKIDENYTHRIGLCYKCKNPIEPLPLEQWFVKTKPLAKEAIEVVKKGKIKIYPKSMEKLYLQFLENIRDWNISRQIVWGIRIPAFKCQDCGAWNVTEGEIREKCGKCSGNNLIQDVDTFDTWFSSGQWPYATLKTNYGHLRMGFHPEVVSQVYKGKTKTYRLRNHAFKVGDRVMFQNTKDKSIFGFGVITESKETTIEKIDYTDKTHFKTYSSLGELMDAFRLRNPDREVTPSTKAYLYAYEFHSLDELKHIPTDFDIFYPTTVMETGYDILRWWVARMVMLGIYMQKKLGEENAEKQVPFKNVVLHGLVNDPLGKKMSKSRGNVVNPLELLDQYGADAVRFALSYGTALGNDQSLSYSKLDAMRKFTNKLWNMARFIEFKAEGKLKPSNLALDELKQHAKHKNDKEIVEKTQKLAFKITRLLNAYDFNHAAQNLYDFAWHEFADIYIEDVKTRINENSFSVLSGTYLVLLKLLHPFMPFVTEEINHTLFGKDQYLIVSQWPIK